MKLQLRKEAHRASNDESMLDQNEVYSSYFQTRPRASHGLHRDLKKKEKMQLMKNPIVIKDKITLQNGC